MSAYGADGRRFESCTGCFYMNDEPLTKFSNVMQAATTAAPLVQLDRMSAYGADGRRFESCTGCLWSECSVAIERILL